MILILYQQQERRKRIYENVTVAVREGIISRNEARERLGLEPISGGDDVYIAANLFHWVNHRNRH